MKVSTLVIGLTLTVLVVLVGGLQLWFNRSPVGSSISLSYQSSNGAKMVRTVADGLGQITQVKLTPDENQLLISNLAGEIYVLNRQGGSWIKQSNPVFRVQTGFGQADENGLTGLILSSEFVNNHQLFLLYAEKSGSMGRNKIVRIELLRQADQWVGTNPQTIFTANTLVLGAHQIQGGESVFVENKPHLLFSIGEGYHPEYARDLTKEAGKIMLIGEDGSNPPSARPYPQYPKIQAIGIRNAYDLSMDPTRSGWGYITHNGPESNDTLLYVPLLEPGHILDFHWDNNADNLPKPLDNGQAIPSYVAYVWPVTVSPTDVVVDRAGHPYINIFSSVQKPDKQILRGEWVDKRFNLQPIIIRQPTAPGGNLLGLAISKMGTLYFGDFSDGMVFSTQT